MFQEYPKIEPLSRDDQKLLAGYLNLSPRIICDLSLANIYAWQDCEAPHATLIHGNLCILIKTHREPDYFLEPLGNNNLAETVKICLNHIGRISRASTGLVNRLPRDLFEATPLRDHFDYLYQVRALAELKGKKFDGKRNQIKKFIRNQPDHEFLPLESRHRDQALALFERWSQDRQNGNGESSLPHFGEGCQRYALTRAFDDFESLGLKGGAIFVAGEMQGFILASEANPEMAVAHFQYANGKIGGIYQLLLQKTCQEVFSSYALLNLEEDLGIPGLRKTKLSYQPLRSEEKYLITPR
jgi:uncharacterized protein